MKRLFRIFELSKNEQRVVLIVMFMLITIALVGYERRVHHRQVRPISTPEVKASPAAAEIEHDQTQSSLRPGIRP